MRLESILSGAAEGGVALRGAQCSVWHRGEKLLERGFGEWEAADAVACVYCALKPMVSVRLLAALEVKGLSVDNLVADVLPNASGSPVGALTIGSLLNNSSGLNNIRARIGQPTPDLAGVLRSRASGDGVAYCELGPWIVVEALIDALCGSPAAVVLADFAAQLGMNDTVVRPTRTSFERISHRVSPAVSFLGAEPLSLIYEASSSFACDAPAGVRAYSTAADIGIFYRYCLERLDVGAVERAVAPERTVRGHDKVMARNCAYGLGFMVDLRTHKFGQYCSAASFGHSARSGSSFGFVDPEASLVVAIVTNGLNDVSLSVDLQRSVWCQSIYEDLGLADDRGP